MTKKDLEAKVDRLNGTINEKIEKIEELSTRVRKANAETRDIERHLEAANSLISQFRDETSRQSDQISRARNTIEVGVDILYPDLDLNLHASELVEPEEAFIKRIFRDLR